MGVDAKETVEQIAQGAYPAFALLAGMQRELFTPLAEGPRSAGELAELLSVDAERLQTLLYALVAAGLLEVAEGRFANGVEAERLLVRGRSGYIGERHWIWSRFYAAALHSAESVRQGGPAVPIDFADQDEGELEPLLRGLHPGSKAVGAELVARLDIAEGAQVLDVGGGSGGVALGMVAARPDIAATVAELPRVARLTRRFIRAEKNPMGYSTWSCSRPSCRCSLPPRRAGH